MRVIKKGVSPDEEKFVASCKCGCVFSFKKKEAISTKGEDHGMYYLHFYVKCPTCGEEIYECNWKRSKK